jgi:hypothetical protein
MDAEASPSRSITSHLRGAIGACCDMLAHLPKLALDIALPTQCVSYREPVDGEGVCAACWASCRSSNRLIARGSAPPLCTIPVAADVGAMGRLIAQFERLRLP